MPCFLSDPWMGSRDHLLMLYFVPSEGILTVYLTPVSEAWSVHFPLTSFLVSLLSFFLLLLVSVNSFNIEVCLSFFFFFLFFPFVYCFSSLALVFQTMSSQFCVHTSFKQWVRPETQCHFWNWRFCLHSHSWGDSGHNRPHAVHC